jgi:hypothetical protein
VDMSGGGWIEGGEHMRRGSEAGVKTVRWGMQL